MIFERIENTTGKGENAGYQCFSEGFISELVKIIIIMVFGYYLTFTKQFFHSFIDHEEKALKTFRLRENFFFFFSDNCLHPFKDKRNHMS